MNQLSGEESKRRWKILNGRKSSPLPSFASEADENAGTFDCSDLLMPASHALVDSTLEGFVKHWKDLDDRKVETVAESNGSDGDCDSSRKRQRPDEPLKWGWHANRLRLPDHFDYASRQAVPPQDDAGGDRVVSLEDPSVHLSFERELWKLCRAVPTLEELEAEAMAGAKCQHIRTLNVEISEGVKKHSRLDCHALSRLRMSYRHGLPPVNPNDRDHVTTVRLECWRRQLKRGSSPDGNRLDLEFLGTQTLKDVHDVIVELTKDELWRDAVRASADPNQDVSGMFLIEDTFYTTGTVDYTSNILARLDGMTPGPPRRGYVGLPLEVPLKIQPMGSVRVEQLRWRLGVRYFHSHHGDVECSVFLTDIRQCRRTSLSSFPIIHDIWTPSYSLVECDACRRRVGVLTVSASHESTDGGPRVLCQPCYQQLHPTSGVEQSSSVQKYSVWRDQGELSVAHEVPETLF
jgi:hypothetical protein